MNRYDFFTIIINKLFYWLGEKQAFVFSPNPNGNCNIDVSEKNGMYCINLNVGLRCLNKGPTNRFLSSLEKISWGKGGRIRSYKPPLKYQSLCRLWVEDPESKEYSSSHIIPSRGYRKVIFLIEYEIPSKEFKKVAKHFGDFLSVNLIIKDSSGKLSRASFQARVHKTFDGQL